MLSTTQVRRDREKILALDQCCPCTVQGALSVGSKKQEKRIAISGP